MCHGGLCSARQRRPPCPTVEPSGSLIQAIPRYVRTDDRRRLSAACLASVLALALLAWLALDVGPVRRLDARILLHVSFHREAWVGEVAGVVGDLGNPWPQAALLAAAVAVGLFRGVRRKTMAAVVLVAGADLTTTVLKHLLATSRFEPILGYAQVG